MRRRHRRVVCGDTQSASGEWRLVTAMDWNLQNTRGAFRNALLTKVVACPVPDPAASLPPGKRYSRNTIMPT